MSAHDEVYSARMKLVVENRKLLDQADAEKRDLSPEQQQEWDARDADIEALSLKIERVEKQAAREDWAKETRGRAAEAADATSHRGSRHDPDPPERPSRTLMFGGRQINVEEIGEIPDALFGDPYRKAFRSYMRDGRVTAGLQTGVDNKGGYLAPMVTSSELIKFIDDAVYMRQLATVLPVIDGKSLGAPSWDTDPGDADWTAEVPASDLSEDTSAALGRRELAPHQMTKYVKISRKLLRASVLDIESLIIQRLGYKAAITEEKAYLTGDGAQQPLGVFTASAQGISTARNTTAAAVNAFTADECIDTLGSLKMQYQNNATWLVHRGFVTRLRKLKSGLGDYLWQPSIQMGQPGLILGRPYVVSENAPNTYTTGLYVAIVGDFRAGYWIVDSLLMEIQRLEEVAALRNQVGFVLRKETDGMPVLEEAFARLILG